MRKISLPSLLAVLIMLTATGCTLLPVNRFLQYQAHEIVREAVTETKDDGDSVVEKSSEKTSTPQKASTAPLTWEERSNAILLAVQEYDLDGLKSLLADVEDVRTAVPEGTLLLHMAEEAMGGGMENEMASFLVSKKAWTLQRDEKGRTADYLIYDYELFDTPRQYGLDALMKESADRYWKAIREDSVEDLKAVSDNVPMDRHVLYDALNTNKAVRVAVYAVEQGAPVNAVEPAGGNTPLHLLCNETPYTHPFDERLAAARALTAAGADVNAKNKQGEPPLVTLVIAKRKDNYNNMGSPVELAKILLEAGADPNALDQGGYSVLYTAANNKMDDLVVLLLEYGVTLDDNAVTKAYNMTDRVRQLFRERGAKI